MLYYSQHSIDDDDINEVIKVLKSATITQGSKLVEFENSVKEKLNVNHAVAVNSATSALHLACIALNLSKGDYLWTSSISFVASSNCGLYCGAKVDFVDINPKTGLISIKALKRKLEFAAIKNKLPKVLIPVHLAGSSCDMESIKELSKEYGFKIIEDASHAIGGKYKDNYVGSCQYSDISVLSFHPVKIITTGEGGMVLTNNEDIHQKVKMLRGHGITSEVFELETPGPWYYEQQLLGFNYRITDIQAALGTSQLKKLDQFVQNRNKVADYYRNKLTNNKYFKLMELPQNVYSSYHLAIIRILDSSPKIHRQLFEWMRENQVWVQLHYWPIHLQPFYKKLGFSRGYLPNSENYAESCFSIPLHVKTTKEQQDLVLNLLNRGIENIFNQSIT